MLKEGSAQYPERLLSVMNLDLHVISREQGPTSVMWVQVASSSSCIWWLCSLSCAPVQLYSADFLLRVNPSGI